MSLCRGVTARPCPHATLARTSGRSVSFAQCPVHISHDLLIGLDVHSRKQSSPESLAAPHPWLHLSEPSRGLSSPGLPAGGIITNAQWRGDGDSGLPHASSREETELSLPGAGPGVTDVKCHVFLLCGNCVWFSVGVKMFLQLRGLQRYGARLGWSLFCQS